MFANIYETAKDALLTKYEAGERKPNAKTLGKIANALKIDICVLMEDWK